MVIYNQDNTKTQQKPSTAMCTFVNADEKWMKTEAKKNGKRVKCACVCVLKRNVKEKER